MATIGSAARGTQPGGGVDAASSTEPKLVEMFVVMGRGKTLSKDMNAREIVHSKAPDGIAFSPKVLSAFPSVMTQKNKLPKDAIRPDQVASFAFPDNVQIVSKPPPPKFFWFVLTGVSGSRYYCAVLHFYEQCDPLEVACLFINNPEVKPVPKWCNSSVAQEEFGGSSLLLDHSKIARRMPVYAAKGLCVVSKYPFLFQFRTFLRQIYRISMSTAPVPLEKYVSNFCGETPAPPRGVIQVVINVADTTIVLRRPPVNKLPQIGDYCLEILFSRLSVDKVVLIWRLLLLEVKIIAGSKTRSVLTPCLDALLKLLFPFFWAGIFIPVLPPSLNDVLDAPVPFIVGVSNDAFHQLLGSNRRPLDACFVDLDTGDVYFDQLAQTPELPRHDGLKLLKQLNSMNIDRDDSFQGNGGPQNSQNAQDSSLGAGRVSRTRNPSILLSKDDELFPDWEPLIPIDSFALAEGTIEHTYFDGEEGAGYSMQRKGSVYHGPRRGMRTQSTGTGGVEEFNDEAVRQTFLRFMCAVLQDYEKHINEAGTDIVEGAFLASMDRADRPFLKVLMRTQMWDGFIRDRTESPGREGCASKTEVGYAVQLFKEHINAKLNRSIKLRTKKPTSFIDSVEWDEHNKFIAPLPLPNVNKTDGSLMKYSYPSGAFPKLIEKNYGAVRRPRRIADYEVQRRANAAVAQVLLQLHTTADWGEEADSNSEGETEDPKPELTVAERRRNRSIEMKRMLGIEDLIEIDVDESTQKNTLTWEKRELGIIRAQNTWRRRVARSRYLKQRKAIICIQCAWGRMRRRTPLLRKRNAAVVTQRFVRLHVLFHHRRLTAATKLASVYRMHTCKRILNTAKNSATRVQSVIRGLQCRVRSLQRRVAKVAVLRKELFGLWKSLDKPLLYRAKFWILFGGEQPTFLEMGVHMDEVQRLREEMVIQNKKKTVGNARISTYMARDAGVIAKLKKMNGISSVKSSGAERASVYTRLKQRVPKETRDRFFEMFHLENHKRRKHKLAEALFENFSQADHSATVMISTISGEDIGVDWVLAKKMQRVHVNIVSSLRGTLRVLGGEGRKRNATATDQIHEGRPSCAPRLPTPSEITSRPVSESIVSNGLHQGMRWSVLSTVPDEVV